MNPNYQPRKKANKKDLTPGDFEEPPVAGPSKATGRAAPCPPIEPFESMAGRDFPNMTNGFWSGAPYSVPYNLAPRSVGDVPIDPSLRMDEPDINPSPIACGNPYVAMGVHSMPLLPSALPGRCTRFLYRADAKPFDSSNTLQCQFPFRCISTPQPSSHLFTRYCLDKWPERDAFTNWHSFQKRRLVTPPNIGLKKRNRWRQRRRMRVCRRQLCLRQIVALRPSRLCLRQSVALRPCRLCLRQSVALRPCRLCLRQIVALRPCRLCLLPQWAPTPKT